MAIFRRRKPGAPLTLDQSEAHPSAKAVLAAGMPMNGPGVTAVGRSRNQTTTEQWQSQAWYYFDVIGELRGPLVWIANAVSQAEVHATELDPATGAPTGPSTDPVAMAAAAQVLGGASQRATLLRLIALCWQVPGETWIIVRPTRQGQPDQWLALAGNKVLSKGGQWTYTDPFTGMPVTLGPNDRLIRCWQPHPADQSKADSAVRPALPICQEIEKASQNIAARLDSRIASNGIMAIADELNLPAEDFMASFMTAAEASLANPGTAASQVPLAFTAPMEAIASGGAFAHYDLGTQFDASVVDLRTSGLERLASTLDMPKDVAEGTQGESNHWSAWQVEESTYKIFIEPLLKAVGDVVTEYWYRPTLIAMGKSREQADRLELGWDTTAIVARPDDRETLESLYEKILISDEYMLTESGVTTDAMPNEEERERRFLEKVILSGVPAAMLADPNVAQALGLSVEIAPVAAGVDAEIEGGTLVTPEPEPAPARALPGTQGQEPENDPVPEGLVAAAEILVRAALDRAGGRLLTRENRGQFNSTPKHELYRHIRPENPASLVDIRFAEGVPEAFGHPRAAFHGGLQMYVAHLLATGAPYSRDELAWYLR